MRQSKGLPYASNSIKVASSQLDSIILPQHEGVFHPLAFQASQVLASAPMLLAFDACEKPS